MWSNPFAPSPCAWPCAGTLYAAKFTQEDDTNGGEFSIEWIELGHATEAELVRRKWSSLT